MIAKRIISGLINASLALTLVAGLFIQTPVKAEAATTGRWVLQSSKTEYGNKEYYGNYWQFKHSQSSGKIVYKIKRTFSNSDGTFSGLFTTTADIPPATISGGQKVSLKLSANVKGGLDNLLCYNSVYLYKRSVDSDGDIGYADSFTKKSDETKGKISVWTGPTSNRQYTDKATVYYVFPEGKEAGERMCVQLEIGTGSMSDGKNNGGLITNWFYVWKLDSKVTAPGKATITNVKSAAAKQITLKWKKLTKNCKGYQIQVATSRNFTKKTIKATKTIKKNTTLSATIKKLPGKKQLYVRVRGYNTKNGKTVYGAWSKVKPIKTK